MEINTFQFVSDGSNNVGSSMFNHSKPKMGVRVQSPIDEDVQVCSMFEK